MAISTWVVNIAIFSHNNPNFLYNCSLITRNSGSVNWVFSSVPLILYVHHYRRPNPHGFPAIHPGRRPYPHALLQWTFTLHLQSGPHLVPPATPGGSSTPPPIVSRPWRRYIAFRYLRRPGVARLQLLLTTTLTRGLTMDTRIYYIIGRPIALTAVLRRDRYCQYL